MSPQRTAVSDVARVRQIVLTDLRKAERSLAEGSDTPESERTRDLSAIRTAITELLRLNA